MKKSDLRITEYMRKTKQCPDCSGFSFSHGPSGGISQNIECRSCGARFNVTMGNVERICGSTRMPEGCMPARFEEPVMGFFERLWNVCNHSRA